MTSKKTILLVFLILLTVSCAKGQSEKIENTEKEETTSNDVSATLSGMAFVTTNLEATVDFYKNFLAFKEHKRIIIESEVGLAPFGVSGDKKLNYVALLPKGSTKDNRNFPALNFIEILDAKTGNLSQDANRTPIAGEIMKAYSVKNLIEIEKRMKAAGVPIITPLALSATGKSMTLCVIDPSGTRVQMYEYVKK